MGSAAVWIRGRFHPLEPWITAMAKTKRKPTTAPKRVHHLQALDLMTAPPELGKPALSRSRPARKRKR
jgi:hypothetical protein